MVPDGIQVLGTTREDRWVGGRVGRTRLCLVFVGLRDFVRICVQELSLGTVLRSVSRTRWSEVPDLEPWNPKLVVTQGYQPWVWSIE